MPTVACLCNSCVLILPRAIKPQVLLKIAEERGMPEHIGGIRQVTLKFSLLLPLCTSPPIIGRAAIHPAPPLKRALVPHQTGIRNLQFVLMLPPRSRRLLPHPHGNLFPKVPGSPINGSLNAGLRRRILPQIPRIHPQLWKFHLALK